jgi:hypothetical protein
MKKYSIAYAFDVEAKNGGDAIDKFLKLFDSDSISYPDFTDFNAKEKEI